MKNPNIYIPKTIVSLRGDILLEYLAIFAVSIFVLVKGVNLCIKSLASLAKYFNIPEFIIATVLMGSATSFPELFVGITSAIENVPQISLGNLTGASLLDATLIIAIPAIIAGGIKSKSKYIAEDTKYTLLLLFLPLIALIDSRISRLEGFILLSSYIVLTYFIIKQKKTEKIKIIHHHKNTFNSFLIFLVGIILLLGGAHFAIKNATLIAEELIIPPILIGIFLISIGTTLPELTFGIKAALSNHPGMALGNIVGSLSVNMLFILGVTSFIRPISPEMAPILIAMFFLLFSSLIFYLFIKKDKSLTVKESVILVFIYIIFLVLEFAIK